MKSIGYKRPVLLLICLSILITAGKCFLLSRITFDMDGLTSQMRPVLAKVHTGTPTGFFSNLKDGDDLKQYLELKYILAPGILLYHVPQDTLLMLENKDKPMPALQGYTVIYRTAYANSVILLVSKSK